MSFLYLSIRRYVRISKPGLSTGAMIIDFGMRPISEIIEFIPTFKLPVLPFSGFLLTTTIAPLEFINDSNCIALFTTTTTGLQPANVNLSTACDNSVFPLISTSDFGWPRRLLWRY